MGLMSWLRGGRGGGSRSGGVPAPAVADRGERVDVNRLEPLQRMVSEQRLTLGPTEFEDSLTTRRDTALGSPLGHLVSAGAPGGLVRGIDAPAPVASPPAAQRTLETPVRGAAGGSGAVRRPGRMRAPGGGFAPGPEPVHMPAAVSVPVQRVYGGDGAAMTSAAGAEGDPGGVEELPVRRLVGERPVVREGPGPGPGPAVDTGPAPASGSAGVQRTGVPPAGERPRRVPGLGAPLPGLPPTAQRRAASADAAASPAPSAVPRAGPGLSTAADLSAAGVPDSDGADRAGEDGGLTAPLLGDDPLVSEVSGSLPGSVGSADASLVAGERLPPGDAGGSVQRSVAPPGAFHPPGPPGSSVSPGPARVPPASGSGRVLPLLGDSPLVPQNVDVQRAVAGPDQETAAAAVRHPVAPAASPSTGVPVRWAGAADSVMGPGPRVSVGPVSAVTVPPPPSAPLQRRAGAGPPVPASVARSLPGSGSARGLPSAGAVAVAAGVAQRMADGSVVFGGGPSSGTSRPVVQRAAEVAEEPPPPEPDPVSEAEPEAEPAAGSVAETGSGSAAGPPKGGEGAPVVTDELVRALYAPLSRLLKNDLRLDRERAGHLINTRH